MNNHLSYITKKCQEANPKLLELTNGCQLKVIEKLDTCSHHYEATIVGWKKNDMYQNCYIVMGISLLPGHDVWKSHVIEEKQISKILGHPPQLSDVLMALGEDFAISGGGHICEWSEKYETWMTDSLVYDLSKPLSEQSPETLEWIAVKLGYE